MTKQNNLEETAIIIFGVTGDLTRRKLIPAIYELILNNRIPNNLWVIGFARRDWDDQSLREVFFTAISKSGLELDRNNFDAKFPNIKYLKSDFDQEIGYKCIIPNFGRKENQKCPILPGYTARCI